MEPDSFRVACRPEHTLANQDITPRG